MNLEFQYDYEKTLADPSEVTTEVRESISQVIAYMIYKVIAYGMYLLQSLFNSNFYR